MDDLFARLGLPRRYALDLAEVERRYLAKSRSLHPDFYHNASVAEQQASLTAAAMLNESYLALRDPFRRVEHLLMLHGGPTAAEVKNLDQAFLMEMMDLRERIDAAKSDRAGLAALESLLSARLRELLDDAGRPFDADREISPTTLSLIRQQLNSAKTLMSLLRDLHSE